MTMENSSRYQSLNREGEDGGPLCNTRRGSFFSLDVQTLGQIPKMNNKQPKAHQFDTDRSEVK